MNIVDIVDPSVYNHSGYDVTSYFRSEVIDILKTVENAASDGFGWNFSTKV